MRHLHCAAIVFVACSSTIASAQSTGQPATQPTAATNLGPTETVDRAQESPDNATLRLRANLAEAYDDNAAAASAIAAPATRLGLFGGSYSAADADLAYRRKGTWAFDTDVSTALRDDPSTPSLSGMTDSGSARLAGPVGRRSRLTLSQSARYAPFDTLSAVGADAGGALAQPGAAYDFALSAVNRLQTQSRAEYEVSASEATKATVAAGFAYQQPVAGPDAIRRSDVGARWSHDANARVNLTAAYDYQLADEGAAAARMHDVDGSVRYDRPLSPTRHLLFTVTGGVSLLDQLGRRESRATGGVRVSRDIGRSWTIAGDYARQFVYFDWLAAPVYANRVNAEVSGRVSPRIVVKFEGAYAGNAEIPLNPNGFTVYSATSTFSYALTRRWGLYAAYSRFHYLFAGGSTMSPLGPAVNRNALRGGLALSLPLIRGDRENP